MSALFHITKCSASIWSRRVLTHPGPLVHCHHLHNTPKKFAHKESSEIEWRPIYKLPAARLVSAFNRLKVYQTILTTLAIPVSCVLVDVIELPSQVPYVVASLGITGVITLCLGSLAFKNLIGLIYVNQNNDSVKIAYVDFWGRRKHIVSSIDNLIPDWEQPKSSFAIFQPVRMHNNNNQSYKLLQRFGVIKEHSTFAHIFGE